MRYALLLGAILFLLAPGLAQAQTWTKQPGGPDSCSVLRNLGDRCYYDFTTVLDSVTIDVAGCRSIDVFFDPDEDGTDTGGEVFIMKAHEPTNTTATSVRVLADTDGDGIPNNATLTGDETVARAGFQDLQATYLWVDVTAVGAGPDEGRVTVTCH